MFRDGSLVFTSIFPLASIRHENVTIRNARGGEGTTSCWGDMSSLGDGIYICLSTHIKEANQVDITMTYPTNARGLIALESSRCVT